MLKNKNENKIFLIFLIIGSIFFLFGSLFSIKDLNTSNKLKTTAVITEIVPYEDGDSISHNVYVKYNINGREYNSKLNTYSAGWNEGDSLEVLYEKGNEEKVTEIKTRYLILLFPALGLIFVLVGGIGILKKKKREKVIKFLKQNGLKAEASYVETIIDKSYAVNGKSPYHVICNWINPNDNNTYTFKSERLWINPSTYIENRNIKTFTVYIDPNNFKNYYLDIQI